MDFVNNKKIIKERLIMNIVNTVCGSILPDELGITLAHEHLVFGFPGWDADTLGAFDRKATVENAVYIYKELMGKYNLKTLIDATTNDCGRNPELYKEISEKAGINVICCTGLYSEEEGAAAYFKFRDTVSDIVNEIYEMFMKDITIGIGNTGIKAGVIKVASSHGQITPYETKVFLAAAKASKETGVPIITHTSGGTMGPQQADLLISEGASPNKIVIGHMSDNIEVKYSLEVLQKGVNIAFDRMGLHFHGVFDNDRYSVIKDLCERNFSNKLLLSTDSISTWLGRKMEFPEEVMQLILNWKPVHIFDNVIPQLKIKGLTDSHIKNIMVNNLIDIFR